MRITFYALRITFFTPYALRFTPYALFMNPFTRFLMGQRDDRPLNQFVAAWDDLEALVIRVFKGKRATAADATQFARLQADLQEQYPQWRAALAPLWAATLVGGAPPTADPFTDLLATPTAADFVDNWGAMQRLPAAREALNKLVLDRLKD
jgi:hypothetical protein